MSLKYRDLIFKRCSFDAGFNGSLQEIILAIMGAFPKHSDRTFDGGGLLKKYRLASVSPVSNGEGLFVCIIALNQNPMGVVNLNKSESVLGVDEHAPPDNAEWLDDDILLHVKDNDILACLSGRKDRVLENMIWKLGVDANVIRGDQKFHIYDVANQNDLDKINTIGVKAVDFDIGDYLCANNLIPMDKRSHLSPILNKLFSVPDSKDGLMKRSSTEGKIFLKRGKFTKHEVAKDKWLTDIGQTLVSESDTDYKIILEDNSVISTKQLKITKRIKIKPHANTVCHDRALQELQQFRLDLIGRGLMEA